MIKLYSPRDTTELALIESILEEDGIPYFVHNGHFGALEVGPAIDIYNMRTIMVDEKYENRSRELLADFFEKTKDEAEEAPSYSLLDKIRMGIEALLFTWFVPGRRRKRNKGEKTGYNPHTRGDQDI